MVTGLKYDMFFFVGGGGGGGGGEELKSQLVLHRIHEGTPGRCRCNKCLELYTNVPI